MRRALDLARMAEGFTSPNPLVGAVIVHNGRIIGEGFHHKAGEPHAEVNAFSAVRAEDEILLPESTMYVTLEPCSHHGKTPPCADLIIAKGVKELFVAMEDPFPAVAGRGLRKLREAEVKVHCGLLEADAEALNRVFLTNVRLNRPYITLKWAQSSDGFIDRLRLTPCEKPELFSSPVRKREVHRLRHLHDAVLVGRRTVEWDNPRLNNRFWWGRQPIRVVLDSHLALLSSPKGAHAYGGVCMPCERWLFGYDESPVWLVSAPSSLSISDEECLPLEGVELLPLKRGEGFITRLLEALYSKGVRSLLVEGGTATLQSFIDEGPYDVVECEVSARPLGEGVPAPKLRNR